MHYPIIDNKKNKYRFDDTSSIITDPTINSTIKENPFRANVELEGGGKGKKGELILRNDLLALHDVVGKKHKNGGVDVYLPDNTFVFSDYEKLALDKKDHKLFELKEGGNLQPSKNTTAEVVRRNIDTKHYNKMSEIMKNPFKDDISKNTAELMLSKYLEKLGQIAYLQESKKGFPNGIPEISRNSAPVYSDDLKDDIIEQKQYMQPGGQVTSVNKDKIINKYKNNYDGVVWVFESGKTLVFNKDKTVNHYDKEGNFSGTTKMQKGKHVNGEFTTGPTILPIEIASSNVSTNSPTLSNSTPNLPQKNPYRNTYEKNIKESRADNAYTGNMSTDDISSINRTLTRFTDSPIIKKNTAPKAPPSYINERPVSVSFPKEEPTNIDWRFDPWQKLSMANAAYNYANVKRLMPMRSQIDSPLIELEQLSERPLFNALQNNLSAGYRANQILNPYLAGANNNQVFAQGINSYNDAIGNLANQNVQIANQQNIANNQIQRQDLGFNTDADQKYYQQTVVGQQNFDNARDVARNSAFGLMNQYVGQNQDLALQLLMNGPNSPYNYDFKTGTIYNTGKANWEDVGVGDQSLTALVDELKSKNYPDSIINTILRARTLERIPRRKTGGYINPFK